ncbi:hypothetical protein AD942_11060 [Gluconobacter japonicus]|uniref:hypothetical protein n=1 Tax=Gluconobacter japonicus TaxID=376620 RepID=UPI0007850A2B|nr:hypothetical protein [Gluconobacter japonicus]KXV23864.1 hypothetical protein AD936_21015 [Gluconobacter japonicus]KXV39288.1 hypothetical protein AD942_11060 [Gluconobacter japonicus]
MNAKKMAEIHQSLMDVLGGEPSIEGLFALSMTLSCGLIGISKGKEDSLVGLDKFSKMTRENIQENYKAIANRLVHLHGRGEA